ncbi:rho GDP dissociation inhibitor Rdi1 [Schizosaccharomyces octosporus yFS286]|uniref:Rho GDP dissociation inhibitor Rdi1 n=1 Tax=Schizosaccharomyces octosporus (strain yFS286) TaxID=483514 RepID=S9Q573_SCHOY|nr:rho GDP dissociation inhibitor Rdi1 [Schizosaccharomyces octosporus yFS286]EPX74788.1 rho GDP dissociation inhibitor Rdi1 [Schizosaccharomyces octosporus yFS286]
MTSQGQAGNESKELDEEFMNDDVPVSLGEKKTLDEYVHMDAEDPSLTKWKESLGISNKGYSPPNDPRTVVIEQLSLLVTGRDPIHVDMQDEASVEQIHKKGFVIKEDSEYRIGVRFRVQHELISGLRYVQVVRRVGMTVDKSSIMIGSYSPNEAPYAFTTEPEEAPSGFLARGHYEAIGKFIDDDQVVHHVVNWSFDVTKSWK